MPAGKLVVSTYLQYILIAVGVFLLVVFVRQLSGVLLTFLMAAVLAYALNPWCGASSSCVSRGFWR